VKKNGIFVLPRNRTKRWPRKTTHVSFPFRSYFGALVMGSKCDQWSRKGIQIQKRGTKK